MAGRDRSAKARILRAIATPVSWGYGGAMRLRNWKYSKGWGVRRLPRPVISVGNVTTGGTGKTPVVRWLCERLQTLGRRPGVLMRGYGAEAEKKGDEQAMLEEMLAVGKEQGTSVWANPNRYRGGMTALTEVPEIDTFVLDDGFQHRRLARDFDLVLVDATNPFGYGRVLPRGLLREPLTGLSRADALLITRADQASVEALAEIERTIRAHNTNAPIYRAAHVHSHVKTEGGLTLSLSALSGDAFVLAGIGNPESFLQQIAARATRIAGHRFFPDHHAYTHADAEEVLSAARVAGADGIVTTDKDWVKLRHVLPPMAGRAMPVCRVELAIRFLEDGAEAALVEQMTAAIDKHE